MRSRFFYLCMVCILCSFSVVRADYGTREQIGTDLYTRIDEGSFSLKKDMIAKRLEGSAKKMNDLLRKDPLKKNSPLFDPSNDFTVGELDELQQGSLTPIFSHLAHKDDGTIITTDQAVDVSQQLNAYYTTIKESATSEQRDIRLIGSLGIFTDGDEKNSWYDLVTDLDEINKVIFSQDIPYNGKNIGVIDLASIFSRATSDSGDSGDVSSYSWQAPALLLSPVATTGALCVNSGAFHLDDTLIRDLNGATQGVPPHSIIPRGGPSEGFDSFGCEGLFCLNIEFIMYKQSLLGGGKTNCIEWVVDKNLKIINEYANKSFIQSNMERNFFEMPFSSFLNLPNLLNMGVIVSSLPPPILNLEPKKAPVTRYDAYKQEALQESLKNWGITDTEGDLQYSRINDLSSDCSDLAITNLVNQTTNQATQQGKQSPNNKCRPPQDTFGSYYTIKLASLRNDYAEGFSNDILELGTFTTSFADRVSQIITIVSKINGKPAN